MNYITFNGRSVICMATVTGPFYIKSILPPEDTERWLKFLKSQENFEYSIDGNSVHVQLKSYSYCYRVMMGQLLKGMNEHSKWLFPLIDDKPEKDFFIKAYKRFKELFDEDVSWRHNQISSHHWFKWGYSYDDDSTRVLSKTPKTKTIPELFKKYKANPERKPIWDTYLGV